MSATARSRRATSARRVKRREDESLLTGRGTYVDNMAPAGHGLAWSSSAARTRTRASTSIDLGAARAGRGRRRRVHRAPISQDDWKAGHAVRLAGHGGHEEPAALPARPTRRATRATASRSCRRVAGRAQGRGGARRGRLRAARAVVDVAKALEEGAPLVHPRARHERVLRLEARHRRDGEALEDADVVVTRRYYQPRLIPNAIEPRGVARRCPGRRGDVTLYSATQVPHILRLLAAATLGLHESKLRVVAPDVGGGFGSKLDVYAEELLALALARRLDRPVKWTEERSEGYVATIHGRDFVTEYTLAATKDGTITALPRARDAPRWAPTSSSSRPGSRSSAPGSTRGRTTIPNYSVEFTGVFTNTTPTDAYRGAGRPEATYVIERTMDALARRARHGPARAAPQELHHGVPGDDRLGPDDRLGRLPRVARQAARACSISTRSAPSRQKRRDNGDAEAARRRVLDLQRDVRPRAVADPRRDPLRGGRLGPGDGPRACRPARSRWSPAPRRTARVTRRRGRRSSPTSSGATSTRSRCSTATPSISPIGLDTYGSRSLPVGGVALWHAGREGRSRRRARSSRTSSRCRRDDLEYDERHLHREGLARQGDDDQGGRVGGVRGPQPPGRDGAGARGDGGLRPAELLVAGRRARRGRRGRHRDGRRAARPLRRDRRRRHRGQPDHRRGAGPRRHHAGHRDRALRGGRATTRTGTCRRRTS